MSTTNSSVQSIEELIDKLQLLGMVPGPQKYYYQFLSSNAGLVSSLGDLVNKIENGTVQNEKRGQSPP